MGCYFPSLLVLVSVCVDEPSSFFVAVVLPSELPAPAADAEFDCEPFADVKFCPPVASTGSWFLSFRHSKTLRSLGDISSIFHSGAASAGGGSVDKAFCTKPM